MRRSIVRSDDPNCVPGAKLHRQLAACRIGCERSQFGVCIGFEYIESHRMASLKGARVNGRVREAGPPLPGSADLFWGAAMRALPYRLLASELAAAPYGLGLFTHRSLRRLLVEPASLHFAKHAFALHLLLQQRRSLCVPPTSVRWLSGVSPVSSGSRWTWREAMRLSHGDVEGLNSYGPASG